VLGLAPALNVLWCEPCGEWLTPVTIVCCAGEGVKAPPLGLTIEDAGVLAQTTPAELSLDP
jgi:hypothetical protein